MLDINPFRLIPAEDRYFIGREDILDEWRQRLTAGSEEWKAGKGWLILAAGGMGKTSLLSKLKTIAVDEFQAHVIEVDFGLYRDLKNPEGLFSAFDSQIAAAPDPGSRARKRVGLPPDTTQKELLYQSAAELLKLTGLQINLGPVGFSPSLPDLRLERPEDFALRMGGIFLKSRGIAERREQPVVVLIDQFGKAHDDVQWANIARLLLGGMLQLRKDGKLKIIFAVAIRPERYALLEARMQRSDLFGPDLFVRKYLNPFDQEDAKRVIRVRAQAHISVQLETGILQAIDQEEGIDPYRLIEAAGAVWAYLYGGENRRSPAELNPEDIRTILTNYYKDATRFIRETDETQWQVLKLLTHYPSGLPMSEIAERLAGSRISAGVQDAVVNLHNQPGYQLITRQAQANESPRYSIAHELLREALLLEIPENERLAEQARKTLQDAVWRYQNRRDVLSDSELHTLWEYRDQLKFKPIDWAAIGFTLLHNWKRNLIEWIDHYSKELIGANEKYQLAVDNPVARLRGYLIVAILHNSREQRTEAALLGLSELSHNGSEKSLQIDAVAGLARLGEPAIEILAELIRNSPDEKVRSKAAEGLVGLGKPALKTLAELAWTSADDYVRLQAAEGLVGLGEPALETLAELAFNCTDEKVRCKAVEGLAGLGKPALKTLADLARNSPYEKVRFRAADGLLGLGEPALEILTELARNSPYEKVRLLSAVGLIGLGYTSIALEILIDMARNSTDGWMRLYVALGLGKLGEISTALGIFSDLARNSPYENVRLQAAEGLAGLGVPVLEILADLVHNSPDEEVRLQAAKGLVGLGEPALNILADLARNSPYEEVRIYVGVVLWKSEETLPLLSIALENPFIHPSIELLFHFENIR